MAVSIEGAERHAAPAGVGDPRGMNNKRWKSGHPPPQRGGCSRRRMRGERGRSARPRPRRSLEDRGLPGHVAEGLGRHFLRCSVGGAAGRQQVDGRQQRIAFHRAMQQQRLAGLAILQPQRGRDLDALLRGARRLRADQRVRAITVEALLGGRRDAWIAQALGQALAVAAGVRIDPFDRPPERGRAAGLTNALDQARIGSRRRLVRRQRQVVPLPVHLGVRVDPLLQRREVRAAERTFEVGVLHYREARIVATIAPRRAARGGECQLGRLAELGRR
mmetsp:Transcript_21056/g.81522  ORF Transcript_21056/g.81522 Transcript_21056/m.81522 type:complete len:276 (-) Transcript_21056:3360-4187(-)